MSKRGENITKTKNKPNSITDFECKIPKYKNRKPLSKKGELKTTKLDRIQ